MLLDLMLPGLNGLDLLDTLHRRRPAAGSHPLGARRPADEAARVRLGASDYVSKPVALDELLARVRVQLRRCTRTTSRLRSAAASSCSTSHGARRA